MTKTTQAAASIALALLVSGCASTSPSTQSGTFSALGRGDYTTSDAATPPASAEEAEKRGDTANRQGDDDRALYEYIRALRMADEPSAEVLYKVGNIHNERGSTALAKVAYEWALRENPAHTAASARLGILHLRERRYQEAEERLKPAVARGESLWWAHNAMGILRDLNGDYGDSVVHYRRAHALNPSSTAVLNNLGYSQYMAGHWDAAQVSLERALNRDRSYTRAWRNLGLLHARRGDYEAAIAALERVAEPAAAHNDVGYIAMTDGQYRQAVTLFDKAKRLSPAYYEAASANLERAERLLADSRPITERNY